MTNIQTPKIRYIGLKTSPTEKMYECIKDLSNYQEINLEAKGLGIPNLQNVIELLKIKRPNLYRYYKLEYIQETISSKKNTQLSVKLTLNKLNQIPEGYKKKLNKDKINTINNLSNKLEGYQHFFLGYIPLLIKNERNEILEKKCEEILKSQENYYNKYNKITEITILYEATYFDGNLFGKEFVNKNKKF